MMYFKEATAKLVDFDTVKSELLEKNIVVPDSADLTEFGYHKVEDTQKPSYNDQTQAIIPSVSLQMVKGRSKCLKTYKVVDLPPHKAEELRKNLVTELEVQVSTEVSALLDRQAKSKGYDSIISAVSYINSNNEQFKADAELFISIRDSIWVKANNLIELCKNSSDRVPSLEQFMEKLNGAA